MIKIWIHSMFRALPLLVFSVALFSACPWGVSSDGLPLAAGDRVVMANPATTQRLIFIHHSCGGNWLSNDNGYLGAELNAHNYYVSETNYGWDAESEDNLGDHTDTNYWQMWFIDSKMSHVYDADFHSAYGSNTMEAPAGENDIIMFKSCYPCSEVGDSIADEQGYYTGLLTYFAAHQDKLFVLITPPGETEVASSALTRQLCDWLVDRENGWLSAYVYPNVFVYDFYCTLSETDSHHDVHNGAIRHVWASGYDGSSPYHDGDNHPNATGNQKATEAFIPLLNAAYNHWKGLD